VAISLKVENPSSGPSNPSPHFACAVQGNNFQVVGGGACRVNWVEPPKTDKKRRKKRKKENSFVVSSATTN
jgi:hypothetical protein